MREDLDPNYKLLATQGIFVYGAYSGDFVLTDEVVSYTESAFYAPGASALNRAWYAARLGFALRYVRGSREKARADLVGSVDGLPIDLSVRKKHYLKATGYDRKRAP